MRRRRPLDENAEETIAAHQARPVQRVHQYTIADKLAILKEIDNGLSQAEARIKYNLKSASFQRDWTRLLINPISQSIDYTELKRVKTSHVGRHEKYPEVTGLIEVTIETFTGMKLFSIVANRLKITPIMIARIITSTFPAFHSHPPEKQLTNAAAFVSGWCSRNGWSMRRVTHVPTDSGTELRSANIKIDFLQHFHGHQRTFGMLSLVNLLGLPLALYYNMDETPIHGNVVNKVTLARTGSRNVPCLTTKCNLKHISALLAVMFDGTVLPPLIVFEAPPGKAVHRQVLQQLSAM